MKSQNSNHSFLGMWLPILRFLLFGGVVMNGFLVGTRSTLTLEAENSEKFMLMIVFEVLFSFLNKKYLKAKKSN